jgi:hypothetical protein
MDGLVEEGGLRGGKVNEIVRAPALAEEDLGSFVAANRAYDSDAFGLIVQANKKIPGEEAPGTGRV